MFILLFFCRNESLLEALSEKDAQLARLEEVGLRTEEAKAEYKNLTQAKAMLLNTIQKQVILLSSKISK